MILVEGKSVTLPHKTLEVDMRAHINYEIDIEGVMVCILARDLLGEVIKSLRWQSQFRKSPTY